MVDATYQSGLTTSAPRIEPETPESPGGYICTEPFAVGKTQAPDCEDLLALFRERRIDVSSRPPSSSLD